MNNPKKGNVLQGKRTNVPSDELKLVLGSVFASCVCVFFSSCLLLFLLVLEDQCDVRQNVALGVDAADPGICV